jgi:hypothetical protein
MSHSWRLLPVLQLVTHEWTLALKRFFVFPLKRGVKAHSMNFLTLQWKIVSLDMYSTKVSAFISPKEIHCNPASKRLPGAVAWAQVAGLACN